MNLTNTYNLIKSHITIENVTSVSLFKTLFFNFHYFPVKIASKLPVIVYKNVKLIKTKGKVLITSQPIRFGMIVIGRCAYGFQKKKDYTIWEQSGGTVKFEEKINIGKGNFICIGPYAELFIKSNTLIGGNSKIICMESITIGENTRFSWEETIIDTDFHETINVKTGEKSIAKKAIHIGKNNWIGFGCTILKGTVTPDFCIAGAKSVLNKNYLKEGEYILLANNTASVKAHDIYRDLDSYVS